MPTYSYACTSCGHRFDIYQAFSDDALTECPECGSALRKQFGNVGVVFKGSGFYRNDARGSSSSTDTASSSSSSSSSDSSSTGSSSPKKETTAPASTTTSTTSTSSKAAS